MAEERIQKVLARAGVSSRRAAEKIILEGRVKVNGQVVDRLGSKADPERDAIRLDGKRIRFKARSTTRVFKAFKPRDVMVTMSDPEERPTIADLVRRHRIRGRIFPVGRLDWDADGLLLLTDDGDLANRVAHPRSHLPKTYRVRVRGLPGAAAISKLREGVYLGKRERTLPAVVRLESGGENASWIRITLTEGRRNQLKRMFLAVGHPVRKIRRIAIGPIKLAKMRVGEILPLTERELNALRSALDRRASESGGSKPGRRARSRRRE